MRLEPPEKRQRTFVRLEEPRPPEERDKDKRDLASVDFDGTLVDSGGDHPADHKEITSEPLDGAVDWLTNTVLPNFDVAIHSTRCNTPEGCQRIEEWLKSQGVPMDNVTVAKEKPEADFYFDDRGWNFDGTNYPSVDEMENFKPWWKKDENDE